MRRLLLTTALLALLAPGAASAYTIKGRGFGHGIGMSQWGAYGYARHGWTYRQILRHYFKHTGVSSTHGRKVRVLLQSGRGSVAFVGVTQGGGRSLAYSKTYIAKRSGSGIALYYNGKRVGKFASPLWLSSTRHTFRLGGTALNGVRNGAYRGQLELVVDGGSLTAINVVPIDSYVKGVVPGEVPASWPGDALKAQAVAARSYALTTHAGGTLFDQYPDTRSQVYNGMDGEQSRSNAAVNATAHQVVKYAGQIATTYFFSASGGRTENVENVWYGSTPVPYLKSVKDPYDYYAPLHKWTIRYSSAEVRSRLSDLTKGSFRGIRVLKRGVSPRIVSAEVVGTHGTTPVSGATLVARLGLHDSWAYFPSLASAAKARRLDAAAARQPFASGALSR